MKAKKIIVGILASLMILALMPISALADEKTENGITAVQTLDKETYTSDDGIKTTVTVTNTNENKSDVLNVEVFNETPEGYKEKTDTKLTVPVLKAGESISLTTELAKLESSNSPQTGDANSTGILIGFGIAILCLVLITVFLVKNKKIKSITTLLTCVLIIGAAVLVVKDVIPAEEGGSGKITLSTEATVGDTKVAVNSSVVYGERTPELYEVSFDGNFTGCEYCQTVIETEGTNYVLPEVGPERAGYTANGWFTEAEEGTQITTETPVDGSIRNLFEHWTANTYTVNFDANTGSGTTMDPQEFVYDAAQNLTANTYSKAGYDFLGWNIDSSAKTALYLDKQEVKNLTEVSGGSVTLFAIWTEKGDVTVTYVSADPDKGTVSPSSEALAPVTGLAQGSTATPANGYHFVNWRDADGWTVGTTEKFVPNKVGGLNVAATYTAYFAPNVYKVTFLGNYESSVYSEQKDETYGEIFVTPDTDPTREGYQFDGWFTQSDGGTMLTAATIVDGTITNVYAHWTQKLHTVTFNIEHGVMKSTLTGEEVSSVTVPDGTIIQDSSDVIYIGPSSFDGGWYFAYMDEGYEFKSFDPASGTVTGDMTINVNTAPKNYTLFIITDHGQLVSADGAPIMLLEVPYGSTFSASGDFITINGQNYSALADEGYVFKRFAPSSGTITNDASINVDFEASMHTVTFNIEHGFIMNSATGEQVSSVTVPDGTIIQDMSGPGGGTIYIGPSTYDGGYYFASMDEGYEFKSFDPASGTVTGDMTINVNTALKNYTVNINAEHGWLINVDGEVITSLQVPYASTFSVSYDSITINEQIYFAYADEGYMFKSFDPTSGTIINDTTININFEQPKYVVEFKIENGRMIGPDGGEVTTINVPLGTNFSTSGNSITIGETSYVAMPNEGYKFKGFDPASGMVTQKTDIIVHIDAITIASILPEGFPEANDSTAWKNANGVTCWYDEANDLLCFDDGESLSMSFPTNVPITTSDSGATYVTDVDDLKVKFNMTGDKFSSLEFIGSEEAEEYSSFEGPYEPNACTVTFNLQKWWDDDPETQSVAYGGKVTKPTDPVDMYDESVFVGWYKESSCENAWNFDTDTVTKDTTIYAKWAPKVTVSFFLHESDGLPIPGATILGTDNNGLSLRGTTDSSGEVDIYNVPSGVEISWEVSARFYGEYSFQKTYSKDSSEDVVMQYNPN